MDISEMKYFYPLSKDIQSKMSTVFEKCVNGSTLEATELEVYGRKVLIPEASKSQGVCRFSFKDLCSQPLGTADYITICNTFHTIFLQDVPVLYFENKNEARRLINFIDAAYESKVKLYCSAEERPEGLLKLLPQASEDDPMTNEMLDELVRSVDGRKGSIDQRRVAFVTGADEIFAFKRAISRLVEMQSVGYSNEPHRLQHFRPYISTNRDQLDLIALRERRLQERLEQQRLLEEDGGVVNDSKEISSSDGEQDWGEEASGVSWRNDLYRRSKQLRAIDVDGTTEEKEAVDKRRKRLGPPKFSRLHFWGFGWWENVVRNKKKK